LLFSFLRGIPFQVGLLSVPPLDKKYLESFDKIIFSTIRPIGPKWLRLIEEYPEKFVIDAVDDLAFNYKNISKTKSFFIRFIFLYESVLLNLWQKRVFSKVSKVWLVSEKEVEKIEVNSNNIEALTTPISAKKITRKGKREFLFIGNCDYPPNVEGLDLIYKIYTDMDIKTDLIIVGNASEKVQKRFDHKHWWFKGFVPKFEDVVHSNMIGLAPIFSGGGIKTKLLDYLALNLNVISSETALKSLEIDLPYEIDVVNTYEEWAQSIKDKLKQDSGFDRPLHSSEAFFTDDKVMIALKSELTS
jgi:hypothetical protein